VKFSIKIGLEVLYQAQNPLADFGLVIFLLDCGDIWSSVKIVKIELSGRQVVLFDSFDEP
jgi:hypothetical protein